jgi:hypothetical protein
LSGIGKKAPLGEKVPQGMIISHLRSKAQVGDKASNSKYKLSGVVSTQSHLKKNKKND